MVGRLTLWSLTLTACSLTALDGLSGGSPSSLTDAGAADGAAPDGTPTLASTDAATSPIDAGPDGVTACPADAVCSSFDEGTIERGFQLVAGEGSIGTGTGRSPPSAALFVLPNAGATSSTGHWLQRSFTGTFSTVTCTFAAALDEIPAEGAVDIAGLGVETPFADDFGLRVYSDQFALISCRESSDCRPEVNAGGLPPTGEYHVYSLELAAGGTVAFSLDGTARATIATKTPLTSPANAYAALGAIYRPYGKGGSYRFRIDDVVCVRAP